VLGLDSAKSVDVLTQRAHLARQLSVTAAEILDGGSQRTGICFTKYVGVEAVEDLADGVEIAGDWPPWPLSAQLREQQAAHMVPKAEWLPA
jgi:hypothetical protein